MRETYTYSDRLTEMHKESEYPANHSQADPAQFDPFTIRSYSSKEIFAQELEEELEEAY